MGLTAATLKEQFGYLRSRMPSYLRKKELVALNSGKRTTVGSGGFFVYRTGDYDEGKRISRRSFVDMINRLAYLDGKRLLLQIKINTLIKVPIGNHSPFIKAKL